MLLQFCATGKELQRFKNIAALLFWYQKQLSVVSDTKRLPFAASLLVICFTISMKKSSKRCDKIVVWDCQRQGMEITDGTGKEIEMNHWERERVGLKTFPLISTAQTGD